MAIFDADKERMVAIELKDQTINLYASIAPLFLTVRSWILDGFDYMLPSPFDVRVAIEQYKALSINRLLLQDYITPFLAAQVGDTVSIKSHGLDFRGDILAIQLDATLDPGTPQLGSQYILSNVAALHTNFGTINKLWDGTPATLENNDVVQYNGAEFRIVFDASTMPAGATIWNRATSSFYKWSGTVWDPVVSTMKYTAEFIENDWTGADAPYLLTVTAVTHSLGSTSALIAAIYDTENNQTGSDIIVTDTGTVIFLSDTKFAGHLVIM